MLIATIAAGKAQFFVEGSVDLGYSSSEYMSDEIKQNPSFFSYSFSPKLGYCLNEKISMGVDVSINTQIRKGTISNPDNYSQLVEYTNWLPGWRFSVFGRYKLWGKEKLSFLVQSAIGIGGNTSKQKIADIKTKTSSSSFFIINVFPEISYNLTDKFSFIAKSNFLNLNFISEKGKNEINGNDSKNTSFEFSALSAYYFNIGINYKFKN